MITLMLLFIACPVKDEQRKFVQNTLAFCYLVGSWGAWESVVYSLLLYCAKGGEIAHLISLRNKDWWINHWVVSLVADKLRRRWLWEACFGGCEKLYERFIFVLEANCKSNLSWNQLMLGTSVRESLHRTTLQQYDAKCWWLDRCCYCMHFDTSRCDLFPRRCSVVTNYKILAVR